MDISKNISNLFMQRAIDLAYLGKSKTAPNPMVGCVIVYDNKIIGEGFHEFHGGPHAEVNAINSVADKTLLANSTLYVSLEPCNHYGKTPPCSLLILEHKIPKVVVACIDSFSEVAGKGIENLRNHGVEVEVGMLEKEARALNKRFFTFHEKNRPYIILKWAESNDGFIDIDRSTKSTGIAWITQPETQQITHKWRSEEGAILVGKNTVINDNPSLTCRAIAGKNPIRIVIDQNLSLAVDLKIFNSESPTIIFNEKRTELHDNLRYMKVDFQEKVIPQILSAAHQLQIQSIIIEGGGTTLQQFIDADLWDEARVLKGVPYFKKGQVAPRISGKENETFQFGLDKITTYYND